MRITTNRLVLREFVTNDWSAVLAYQRDPHYLRFYPWTNRTKAEVRNFVLMFLNEQKEMPRRKFQLVITLQNTEQLIGNCGIRRKLENDWEPDV